METDFAPRPHEEAIALIRNKKPVSRDVFYGLLPELRGRAFAVSGVEGADALQRIRDAIAALPRGGAEGTWDKVKQSVVDELDASNFSEAAAERRATLLVRTHGFQAFQASNWRVAQEDVDTTHLQYLATEDDRVRDSHLALNGITLPKNDPFWDRHYPPWEWGCRCRVRPMNPDMVAEEQQSDEQRIPEDRNVVDGATLDQLRNGTLVRNGQRFDVTPPSEKPGGANAFSWHPDDLRLPLDNIKERYDPEVWAGFEAWSKSNSIGKDTTVWDWLNGGVITPSTIPIVPKAPKTHPAPLAAPNKVQQQLEVKGFLPPIIDAAAKLPSKVLELLKTAEFKAGKSGVYFPHTKTVQMNKDVTNWSGHPMTFFHEVGHHVHYEADIITNLATKPEVATAIKQDLAAFRKWAEQEFGADWRTLLSSGKYNAFKAVHAIADKLGLSVGLENLADSKRVSRITDTIMGLSAGKYGSGHSIAYMKRNGPKEVFAHAFSAIMEGDQQFMQLFPNMVDLVKKELNL